MADDYVPKYLAGGGLDTGDAGNIAQYYRLMGGGGGQRDNIAQALMAQQQQPQSVAPSGSQVPAPTPGMSPAMSFMLGNMVRAQQAQGIAPPDWYNQLVASSPKEVYGPYGGGAMGQPQIPSGYNAFSGAGLPPTNIGQGGLTPPGGGDQFAGGGMPYNPPPQQTPFQERFQGGNDFRSLTGPSETFDRRFPDPGGGFQGGSSTAPYPGYGPLPSYMNPNPGS
jgi:hypothetical protein